MAELKLFDIPGAFNSGYDRGRQMRQANTLNQLAAQAYGAPVEQQDALVRQAIASDAASGLQLGQALDQDEGRRTRSLVNMARMLTNAPDQARPQLYQRMLPSLQRFGVEAPPQYDDTVAQTAQAIVQAYGLADGSTPTEVRAFQAMTQGLTPDEQERARRIHLGLEGRASNAGMGFGTFKDAQGFERPQRSNPRTGQVEIWYDEQGRWVPLGQAQGAGVTPAAGSPLQTTFTGADGTPVRIDLDPDVPPALAADIMRNEAAWAAAPDMSTANLPEQRVAQFSGTPAGLGRGRRPEDEAAARRAAEQAVDLQFAPAKAEAEAEAAARRKSAEQSVERMPPAVLKTVTELEERASTADGIRERMQEHRRKIEEGKLDFGPVANLTARARNFAGNSNEQSRNFQLFMSDLEKMRNDSLRLNNGVQTEGDAQRAWNELFANLNDREYVLAGLDRIDRINQRAAELYRNQAANIRAEYPASGTGMYAPAPSDGPGNQFQSTAPVADVPRPGDVQDGYRFLGGNPADPSAWERL